ncbi:hypothetical protein ILYODFUR_034549 [Ilyodon furcidens]|uniref:Uncharacterized protein n=1 Tax=Ilyodon furcidens TaxID=33524 RepID=A0ABV0U322_9TELE
MSSIPSCLTTFFDHFCILDFPVLPDPHWMSLASGSRPCFCLSTKASCLTPGFFCLSLPPWFHPVTAPPLTTEPWIFPPVGNPTSGCGEFCTDPPGLEIARTVPSKGAYSDSSALHGLC